MQQRARTVLFWLATILFACSSWAVIKYAQGYTYNFEEGRLIRTGALAVSANTDATLFVDHAEAGSLSFVAKRAGRDRLMPGLHTIQLVRDGYSAWQKEITVHEGELVDFPNALILPTDAENIDILEEEASRSLQETLTLADATPAAPSVVTDGRLQLQGQHLYLLDETRPDVLASASLLAERVLGFQSSDNNDRVIWWTRNEVWIHWLRDTTYQPYRSGDERILLGRWTVPLQGAAFFRGRNHVVVDLGWQIYRVLEVDTRGGVNVIRL